MPCWRAQIDLNVLLLQGEGQLADQLGIAFDDQHPRLAGGEDQAAVGVVVEQRVACRLVRRGPCSAASRSRSIDCWKRKRFSPFLIGLRFADDLVRAAIDLDQAFVVVVGVDHDFDVERLALADLGRHVDRGDLHFRLGARGSGTVETGTPLRTAAFRASPAVSLPSLSSTICGT